MTDPSERLARLREEGRSRPPGSRWWAEADAQFLLDVAEAALRVADSYPDACGEEGTVMEALAAALMGEAKRVQGETIPDFIARVIEARDGYAR